MQNIGEILKQNREKTSLSLPDISQQTNIPQHLLKSLENNEYENFPGKFYYLNFLKNYLKIINYDIESFFKTYKRELDLISIKNDKKKIHFSKLKYSRFKNKRITLLLILSLIILILILGYFYFQKKNTSSYNSSGRSPNKQNKTALKPSGEKGLVIVSRFRT